jgi:hypothetical protein
MKRRHYLFLLSMMLFAGCTTTLPQNAFIANTFIGDEKERSTPTIGIAHGEDCQTMVLYVFPLGDNASAKRAMQRAMQKYEQTRFLADVSIETITYWKVGYAIRCVTVTGSAH